MVFARGYASTFEAQVICFWSPQTQATEQLGWAYAYDDNGTLLGEYGMGGAASSGSTQHIYLPTAQGLPLPVAAIINGQHFAVHTDHLNTPRRLTRKNGQVAWQWAFSAFGETEPTTADKRFTSASTNPATGTTTAAAVTYNLRYPGQVFDKESGLHYNYYRTYDPKTGRYTQADPIGLDGGWNRYGYVGGNPLLKTDPTGLLENFTYDIDTHTLTSESCECMSATGDDIFSGNRENANKRSQSHIPETGPIPAGTYYIVEPYTYSRNPFGRHAGERFYKLYPDDGKIDDETWVPIPGSPSESVLRGQFRFHPGSASNGCITLRNKNIWKTIQDTLSKTTTGKLPNGLMYYGTVVVK